MVRIIVTSIELRWKTMLLANESQCQNLKHWFKVPDINNDFFWFVQKNRLPASNPWKLKNTCYGGWCMRLRPLLLAIDSNQTTNTLHI